MGRWLKPQALHKISRRTQFVLDRDVAASAHFPKFVLRLEPRTFHELRKAIGTGKVMILVPLFYLTFLDRIRRLWCRNVK